MAMSEQNLTTNSTEIALCQVIPLRCTAIDTKTQCAPIADKAKGSSIHM